MAFSPIIDGLCSHFANLKYLLAKATSLRSGDVLAGLAAESARGRVAAPFARQLATKEPVTKVLR
jgi:ethanolamine ammonia-lyase large subunit